MTVQHRWPTLLNGRAILGAVLCAAFASVLPAGAATFSGSFRLAPGHAARSALYFVVTSPGRLTVRVESRVPEPVTVTVYAGTTAIHRMQGERTIRFTVDATGERIAGGSEWAIDTLTALVGWARSLTHFSGPVSRGNFRDHWGYDGDMPVSRAVAGTRYTGSVFASTPGYEQIRHYTAGCQGTAGLFASVLRAANIPVRPRAVSNDRTPHATVLFLSEDRALSHGDDPYSLLVEGADPSSLLVDLDTYTKWLGPGSKDAGRYIGRQALALGLARLPPIVRRTHERDRQQGLAPEQSGVFALFKGSYFMAELQEARLWERLEAARLAEGASAGAPPAPASDAWLEAETVKGTVTAGALDAQPLDGALLGTWRNQQQLRWSGARPGAELTLPFEVKEPGSYRLSVRFTRAPDYAIVVIRLDDEPTPLDRVSLYAPQMVAADPLSMGVHELAAGSHRLRFSIVGAHPQARADYVVGIDAVRLERLR